MTKNVTVRVHEELHKPARTKVAELDTSFQEILLALLEDWVHGKRIVEFEPLVSLRPEEHAAEFEQLQTILEHGTKEQVQCVRNVLKILTENHAAGLGADEKRLLDEYRRGSWEKRRQILAVTAKIEDLAPEVMPGRRRETEIPKSAAHRKAK